MIELGQWGPWRVNALRNVFAGFLAVWLGLAAVARILLNYDWVAAIGIGLLATLLHWALEVCHHIGHWLAGQRAGYAMNGLTFVYMLALGRYPHDEPELPAEIHIQRALGGPTLSAILALLSGGLAWALWPRGDAAAYLAVFAFLDNLLVFTIGALLPLGFTDGSTLLFWWPRRR